MGALEATLGKETPYRTFTSKTILLIHRFGIFGRILYVMQFEATLRRGANGVSTKGFTTNVIFVDRGF